MEVVAASWDVVAEPPGAGTVRIANAEERVEGSGYAIVGRWYQCAANTTCAVASVEFDARQVCLEGKAAVVHVVTTSS